MSYELVTVRDNVYNFYHDETLCTAIEFIEVKANGSGFITVTDEDEQELYLRASEVITIRKM